MRLSGWILRFKNNYKGQGTTGPLTTDELTRAEQQWIHLVQAASRESPKDIETMNQKFWILQLRSRVKTLIHHCNSCKRERVKGLHPAAIGDLPTFRTEFTRPWAIVGVDYCWSIRVQRTCDTTGATKERTEDGLDCRQTVHRSVHMCSFTSGTSWAL